MTLQSSGAISLANIQTEFGGSNPISISEYYAGGGYVPSGTGSIPTSGTISFSTFYGTTAQLPTGYWISEVTYPSTQSVYDGWRSADFDSSGNVYAVSTAQAVSSVTTSSPSGAYAKFNSNGILQWHKSFTKDNTAYWRKLHTVKVLPNGNIAMAGAIINGSNTNGLTYVVIDSSGTIQYSFSKYTGGDIVSNSMAVDSSSNIYTVMGLYRSTSYDGALYKHNSSLTEQFNVSITEGSYTGGTFIYGVELDSSGNIYMSGMARPTGGGYTTYGFGAFVAKADSSGNLQWSGWANAAIGSSSAPANFQDLVVSSAGNVYGVGYSNNLSGDGYASNGTYYAILVKYNSSGTYQHQRYWKSGGSRFTSAVMDSSGNYYVLGFTGSFGSYKGLLLKYNSSDVLQWARTIRHTTANVQFNHIAINSAGTKLLLSGYRGTQNSTSGVNGNTTSVIVCVPTDGSKTGTYGSYVYEANSDTEGTAGLNVAYSTTIYVDSSGNNSSTISGYGTTYTVSSPQDVSVTTGPNSGVPAILP